MPAARRFSRSRSGRVRARAPRTVALVDGSAVEVQVKEVARAKLLRLRLRNDGQIRVHVPAFTSDRQIDRFVAENQAWIEQALAAHRARSSKLGFAQAGKLPLRGELVPLVRAHGPGSSAFLGRLEGELVVGLRGPRAKEPDAIARFLREQARAQALELVGVHAPALQVSPSRVRIADPATRWGSASTIGTISFSWRLALAPAWVFEYVVVHELCHLLEMNHSPRFWAHVERTFPRWREAKAWLGEHSAELRSWRPQAALPS